MLILTRRIGEALIISDDIDITVLGIKGNQIRLGIEAPQDISVHRHEIYQKIQKEKEQEKKSALLYNDEMVMKGGETAIETIAH